MNSDEEKWIENLKKRLSDYLEIAPRIGINPKEIERQTDIMLDDLNKALKRLKKK